MGSSGTRFTPAPASSPEVGPGTPLPVSQEHSAGLGTLEAGCSRMFMGFVDGCVC